VGKLAPTCNFRCPEKKGTCFPDPCKLYREPSAIEAAKWRLQQCRKTVREGEDELRRRMEALEQAEIAYAALAAPPTMQERKG
jgi:hypothetical protein